MQWGKKWDGTRSNKHEDFGEDKINYLISSTDISLNDENEGDNYQKGIMDLNQLIEVSNGEFKISQQNKNNKTDQLNVYEENQVKTN